MGRKGFPAPDVSPPHMDAQPVYKRFFLRGACLTHDLTFPEGETGRAELAAHETHECMTTMDIDHGRYPDGSPADGSQPMYDRDEGAELVMVAHSENEADP